MPQVTSNREFPVPRKEAFEYVTDPKTWPTFYSNLIEITDPESTAFGKPGDTVSFVYSILGRRVNAIATLQEIVYGEVVRHTVKIQGLPDVHQEWEYSDTDDGFTVRVTMNTDESTSLFGKKIDRFVVPKALQRDLERTLENMEAMFAVGIPGE